MSSKQKFMELAESAGLEVEINYGFTRPHTGESFGWMIELECDPSLWFAGNDCSVDCSIQGPGKTPNWKIAASMLRNIIDAGFEPSEWEDA